ncbi:MAG: nucleotidyltransferase domain-containing protein [Lachnospiraceae bacterium]|nr:nucleotidyltransferase domain-containing protein [Lachnospiraceae bacterium]
MNFDLNENVINENKRIIRERTPHLVGDKLREVVVFGSCARGDYRADSDMDVAVIIDDSREAMNKYVYLLGGLSTDIAIENFSVVNFLCIPADDYTNMRDYALYHNVSAEGMKIFG